MSGSGGAVDRCLAAAAEPARDRVLALIVPHAGLMYSGPVAAHAYGTVRGRSYDVAVLVGPSHFVGFDGVSIYERGAFATPLGPVPIAATVADRVRSRSLLITSYPAAHKQEHSLELQLPFLRRVLPETPIVPLVIGYQVRATILALADVLADPRWLAPARCSWLAPICHTILTASERPSWMAA